MSHWLTVEGLGVRFASEGREVGVVHDIGFTLDAGETLAIVGESGSGKSVTSLALMGLLPPPPRALVTGRAVLHGAGETDLVGLSERRMRAIRGDRIAMIFQEPLTSLNPVHRVGRQIVEAIRCHRPVGAREARARAAELLEQVGIPDPAGRLDSYPHELSGGMRQRVVIAIALALEPDVLIADEPTTALDVTVQAQILELLKALQQQTGMGMLFVTHNFGVVAEIADRALVMYAGRVVEEGAVGEVLTRPLMPYTAGLMRSVPRLKDAGRPGHRLDTIEGFVPDPAHPPAGCPFHPRCGWHEPGRCDAALPGLEAAAPGHRLRCHRWREIERGAA